jgi:4-hydroxy-4-methyl-2-oxoglutarate aldolase
VTSHGQRTHESGSAARYSSATAYEALGGTGAVAHAIKPVSADMYVWGRAFTVLSAPGDNLRLHQAIYRAAAGDVLVVSCSGAHDHGYWGEVMTIAAMQRGIAGIVIDGCVRDGRRIAELGFPVFARGMCVIGTSKNQSLPGGVGVPVSVGGVKVTTGDFIVGDMDGVVAVGASRVEEFIEAHQRRELREQSQFEEIRAGRSTLDIFGLAE